MLFVCETTFSAPFFKNFLVCPVPEIFLCFAVPCAAFRFWIPRGVSSFYTVYMIPILCPRYFLWFSEIPELCGDFPVFPPFIPLPRHVVVHCFFILLRYSFLLFSMPRFIFLVYSAVKWLLPRKVFLLQGNLFDALVSRQRFDYFRTFVLPHRFYFCRVKFLLCVALSVLELYFRAPILYRWLIFLCFFLLSRYCLWIFYALFLFAA